MYRPLLSYENLPGSIRGTRRDSIQGLAIELSIPPRPETGFIRFSCRSKEILGFGQLRLPEVIASLLDDAFSYLDPRLSCLLSASWSRTLRCLIMLQTQLVTNSSRILPSPVRLPCEKHGSESCLRFELAIKLLGRPACC